MSGPGAFGPFALERRIAVGGTSEVYVARAAHDDGRFPAEFILKRPLPEFQRDPKFRAMFTREAQLQSRITHPNVVKVLDFGREGDESYLITELVDGIDADRLLRRLRHERRSLDPALIAWIACEMLEGLAAVHEACGLGGKALGIVHRDVTPSNVYLSREGRVLLGDFGLAHSLHDAQWRSQTGTAMKGKFGYLAPEQVSGDPADQRADLFSAAAVIAEFLLGHPLFPAEGQLTVLLAIRDARIEPLLALDSPMVPILRTALARMPGDRVTDARSLARALQPFAMRQHDARASLSLEVERNGHSTKANTAGTPVHGLPAQTAGGTPRMVAPPSPLAGSGRARSLARGTLVAGAHPHGFPLVREPAPPPAAKPASEDFSEREASTSRYPVLLARVHRTDGSVLGPYTYARMVEALVTGDMDRSDRLELESRGLVPIEDVPSLVRFLRSARATERPPTAQDPIYAGKARNILAILGTLYRNEETGVLLAERPKPHSRKEIYLHKGALHHVQSSERSELLGEYLCRRGLLDRGELEFALAALPQYGGRLGDTLIALGLADPMEIFRAIRAQGRDRVLDLFRWQDGDLSFRRAPESPQVEFPLDLDLLNLMLAGVDLTDPGPFAESLRASLDRKLQIVTSTARHAERVLARVRARARRPCASRRACANLLGSAQGHRHGLPRRRHARHRGAARVRHRRLDRLTNLFCNRSLSRPYRAGERPSWRSRQSNRTTS